MIDELKIEEYLSQIDSDAPSPGGGSVAGIVGAFGVALGRMYGHLSIGKKRFVAMEETDQKVLLDSFAKLEVLKNQLVEDAEIDLAMYPAVIGAYRLPKGNEEEKEIRRIAIQKASMEAAQAPLTLAKHAMEAMEEIEKMIPYGNPNVVSDAVSGAILLAATVEVSLLNVDANVPILEETEEKKKLVEEREFLASSSQMCKVRCIQSAQKI